MTSCGDARMGDGAISKLRDNQNSSHADSNTCLIKMGDSALQNPPGPERTYTAPALTRGRSRRRPKPWMSVRRSRGRRRVGLRGGCPFKEAGGTREGRMRPSLVQEAKRTSSACLRGIQPEGPGSCRQEPEHVAPVTGYGAKAPAGFPLWMSMVNSGAAIPGRNDRYGARCDAHRLSQGRHRTTHGASHRAPLPQWGDELEHPAGPRPCE